MKFTNGSRKLFLILACLRLDFESYLYSSQADIDPSQDEYEYGALGNVSSHSIERPIRHNDSVWIVDEASNQCLGPHGFSECSTLSSWVWMEDEMGTQLKHADSSDNQCLGWKLWQRKFEMMDCHIHRASILQRRTRNAYWSFDFDRGTLQTPSKRLLEIVLPPNPLCIVNDNRKRLQKCRRAQTRLRVVPIADIASSFHSEADDKEDGEVSESNLGELIPATPALPDQGFWHCPITGQPLPRNLDRYEISNSSSYGNGRQVLMGAGVYTKVVFGMKFTVYTVGWYVDAAAAQSEEALQPFMGKSLDELRSSQDFYNQMSRPSSFDRTLFIKLAMNLKKDVVIQGIVDELPLKKSNAKLLLEASNLYPETDCQEGMEIVFKWTQARKENNHVERLDIMIGDMVIPLLEPGLAEDFFYQYMRPDEPVAPLAKDGFAENFPILLTASSPYVPSSASVWSSQNNTGASSGAPLQKGFSFTKLVAKMLGPDHRQVKRMKRWKARMNSIILKRHKNWKEEVAITIAVIFYCLLLILVSMPPAMIAKGVRVVARVKRRSMRKLHEVLERTISRSSSLAALARPSSLAALARSTSSDLKVFFKME